MRVVTYIVFWQLIRNRYPSEVKRLFDDVLGIYDLPLLIYAMID